MLRKILTPVSPTSSSARKRSRYIISWIGNSAQNCSFQHKYARLRQHAGATTVAFNPLFQRARTAGGGEKNRSLSPPYMLANI